MPEEGRSSEDLEAVAQAVIERLRNAGFNAFREMDEGEEPGVEVRTDSIDDANRGVYLGWYPGARIRAAVVEAMEAKRYDDPVVWESGMEKQTKIDEVAAALDRVGVRTEDPESDLAPFTLRVISF